MFHGREVKKQLEQASQIKAQSCLYEKVIDAMEVSVAEERVELDQLGMSAAKMDRSLTRVVDCAKETKELQSDVNEMLDEIQKEADHAYAQGEKITLEWQESRTFLEKQCEKVSELQEQSKHYTGLSKTLSAFSKQETDELKKLEKQLQEMTGFWGSTSTLALHSAIQAGRMGESGKEYIQTAEEIRCLAESFSKKMTETLESVGRMQTAAQEMEKQMRTFISLLRDNNILLGKIAADTEMEIKKEYMTPEILQTYIQGQRADCACLQEAFQQVEEKQKQILSEMENVGSCYMEQQDSTAKLEEIIQTIKRMLSDIDKTKETI